MKIYKNIYLSLISLENLFNSWHIFKLGKSRKVDIQEFSKSLEKNIFELHDELLRGEYKHGAYEGFHIYDPKLRFIHKAKVRDRIIHQAIYSVLTPIFEPMFINHSYSCRINKGTHKAVKEFESMLRKVSKNYTGSCYVLKCDVKKFFDSVNHKILLNILKNKIKDSSTVNLLNEVISSFSGFSGHIPEGQGLPIGNLTSQIFANIYLNELDQFIKHELKERHYIRYADDFIIISKDNGYLKNLIDRLDNFLQTNLKMQLHPNKVYIDNIFKGIDFLGYKIFPHHILMRTKTKHRMIRNINNNFMDYMKGKKEKEEVKQVFQSYFGIMSHANCFKLSSKIKNFYWIY